MAKAKSDGRKEVIARAEKLRGQGDRAAALAVAYDAQLVPSDVPTLDGYLAYQQERDGIAAAEAPAEGQSEGE